MRFFFFNPNIVIIFATQQQQKSQIMLNKSDIEYYGKQNVKTAKKILKTLKGKSFYKIKKISAVLVKLAETETFLIEKKGD